MFFLFRHLREILQFFFKIKHILEIVTLQLKHFSTNIKDDLCMYTQYVRLLLSNQGACNLLLYLFY